MNNKISCLSLLFIACFVAACGGSGSRVSDSVSVEIQPEEVKSLHEPQYMQTSEVSTSVPVGSREYQSMVIRRADESLPIVSNEAGQKFVDNRITLTVREGSRAVLDRTFTKADFSSFLSADFQRNGILEGLVFDHAENGNLLYAASVAYPESDLYVPFRITVTPSGGVSIVVRDIMDDYEATEQEPE